MNGEGTGGGWQIGAIKDSFRPVSVSKSEKNTDENVLNVQVFPLSQVL